MFLDQTTVLVYPASIAYDGQSCPWVSMIRAALIKNAVSSSPHDSQEIASLNEDIERSSVLEDCTSPTPPSQVLALLRSVICGCMLHTVSSL